MKSITTFRLALVGLQFGLIPPLIVCGLEQHWQMTFSCAMASLVVAFTNLSLTGVSRA
jgi:hypothetical protein